MLISFDRTDSPMIVVEGVGVETHLLPITKWQFKQFVDDGGQVSKQAYQAMLDLNPAISAKEFKLDTQEGAFISGILANEALAFAEWLGEGYDLPTVEEWHAIYLALKRMPLPQYNISTELVDGPLSTILDEVTDRVNTISMLDLALMERCLVEWATRDKTPVGVGAPRLQFYPNLWDPFEKRN